MPSENPPPENRLPPGSDGYSPSDALPALARTHANHRASDVERVEDLVVSLPLPDLGRADAYPRWHSSYPREAVLRALLLKHILGLSSDAALRRHLRADPFLLGRLGFDTVPDQSTFWRARNRRFTDDLLGALREAARELASVARDHGLDAPGPVERDDRDEDAGRDGRLSSRSPVTSETEKLASEAKRLVHPHLSLDRADNSCIPESAFWALQTFCGLREDLSDEGDDQMFADVAGWFSESDDEGGEERRYAVFETNAPLDTDAEGDALVHEVASVVRRYRDRWTVENSFKSIKQFSVPTTSRSPVLRFFNFAFACLLFDVWRVVDLLVRQALGVEDGPVVPFSRVLSFLRRETGVG